MQRREFCDSLGLLHALIFPAVTIMSPQINEENIEVTVSSANLVWKCAWTGVLRAGEWQGTAHRLVMYVWSHTQKKQLETK